MSVQTQNTNLNPYSNTPIKNLEYIQNKALVIAPTEITKNGLLDTDLMLDTPGTITMYLYKKIVAGEDKEPTADRFKTIKTMSDLVLSGLNNEVLISTFGIPVIFKYDKLTGTRIIEKDLSIISEVPEYIDLTIDISNGDFSSETGSGGFFCVCQVQKIQKPIATTAFNEVANDAFLFMIPSTECRELSEDTEFELLDSDNKVINIKRHGVLGSDSILEFDADFFGDGSNIATYLFDGNVRDLNLMYNGTATNITYGPGKFGQAAIFNGTTSYINTGYKTPTTQGKLTVSYWVYLDTPATSPGAIYGTSEYTNIYCSITAGQIQVASLQAKLYYFPKTKLVQGWNHIVVHHTTTPILYVNNQQVLHTATNTSIGVNMSKDLWFGRIQNSYSFARIDQVRIFNRVLTETEVNVLYNSIPLSNDTKQGYRIYPVMKIQDHTTEETSFNPKYYLGTKYQRNLSEILSQGIKSKRTIFNLKDMYLVDDQCIQTLKKINILLENNQMIKFTERLYNLTTPIKEKLNADLILEYLSIPITGTSNSDINSTLKTSLIEDYNFTQEEIDNLNDNINTFKSRARMNISTPVIQGINGSLDQLRFNLPKTFIDGNRSKTEKKNLLVFGTNAGFNKFGLSGYSAPYSNVTKRDASSVLNLSDLTLGLPTNSTIKNEIGNNVVGLSQNSDTDLYMYFTENNNVFISGRIAWNSTWEQDSVYTTALQLDLSNITTESKIKMVDCSERTMLILYENGDLYACGSSAYGVIPVTSMVPILIKQNIKHISAGVNQFAILDTNNDLYTIGDNYWGNFNTGNSTDKTTWFKSASNVKSYSFCTSTLAVIYNDDTLWMCGGRYANFQSSVEVKTLTKITIPAKVKKIISRTEYTIILFENNSIRCSGSSDTIWTGNLTNTPRINVNPGFTATNIYGGHTQGMLYVSNNKLYGVPKLVISGNIAGNYGYTDLSSYFGDIQDIQDIKMYKSSIKIIKNDKNLYSIGRNWSGTFGNGSGADTTYYTLQLTNPRKFTSDGFKDILTNYKQQIPFTYIPLSTDIKDINDKPVFENLDNITGFEPTDIVIDIPNVL